MSSSAELVHQEAPVRELAHRVGDGLEVQLLWKAAKLGEVVILHLSDEKSGFDAQVEVPRDKALDAFHHPFLYVPHVPLQELDAA